MYINNSFNFKSCFGKHETVSVFKPTNNQYVCFDKIMWTQTEESQKTKGVKISFDSGRTYKTVDLYRTHLVVVKNDGFHVSDLGFLGAVKVSEGAFQVRFKTGGKVNLNHRHALSVVGDLVPGVNEIRGIMLDMDMYTWCMYWLQHAVFCSVFFAT